MLQTLDDFKKADMTVGQPVNGVDNPNLISVDSTEVIQTSVDKVEEETEQEKEKVEEKKPEEKKPEEKVASPESKLAEEKKVEEEKPKVEEDKTKEKEEFQTKVEKRIGDLTKKWRTAERTAEYEKSKRLEAEAKLNEALAKMPAEGKPKRSDYEDEDAYFEALTDWKIETKLKASQASVAAKVEDATERAAVQETYSDLDKAMDSGREKYADFNDVVLDKDLVLSPETVEAVLLSENPGELLYHLGKNPDVSAGLAKMSPLKLSRELVKIEQELGAGKVSKPDEKPKVEKPVETTSGSPNALKKTVTNAPAPINPPKVDGLSDKDPSQMTPKEYRAWRESQR